MFKGTSLVSAPLVWVKPAEPDFEPAKARFLSGEEDDRRFNDEKFDMDDPDGSPF